MKKEAGHVVDVQMGGPKRLPVFKPVVRDGFELRNDVPKTRADCPQTRPCPHIKCEHNAWMVTSQDRPGRRWVGGNPPPSIPKPTIDQNCVADWAEAAHEGMQIEAWMIAAVLGVTERQVRRYAEKGMAELERNPDANRELADAIEEARRR